MHSLLVQNASATRWNLFFNLERILRCKKFDKALQILEHTAFATNEENVCEIYGGFENRNKLREWRDVRQKNSFILNHVFFPTGFENPNFVGENYIN